MEIVVSIGERSYHSTAREVITPPAGIPLPPGNFRRVAHDFEAQDGLIRVGMPEVLSMYLNQYTDLTEDWQWFWFRQLVHAHTGYVHWDERRLPRADLEMLKAKWRSLTKKSEAFTNFKGTNNCKDYVTPNHLSDLPGQEPLTCCGNVVKVLGEAIRLAGEMWVPIETLDGAKHPPPIAGINRLTRPDLIQSATNVAANKPSGNAATWTVIKLPDGTWRVDPFPQLAPRHTPFALRTHGKEANELRARLREKGNDAPAGTYMRDGIAYAVNYVRLNRLTRFLGSVVPNPFNPTQ